MKLLKMIAMSILFGLPIYADVNIDLMDKYLREGIQAAIENQLEAKGFKVVSAEEEIIKEELSLDNNLEVCLAFEELSLDNNFEDCLILADASSEIKEVESDFHDTQRAVGIAAVAASIKSDPVSVGTAYVAGTVANYITTTKKLEKIIDKEEKRVQEIIDKKE